MNLILTHVLLGFQNSKPTLQYVQTMLTHTVLLETLEIRSPSPRVPSPLMEENILNGPIAHICYATTSNFSGFSRARLNKKKASKPETGWREGIVVLRLIVKLPEESSVRVMWKIIF